LISFRKVLAIALALFGALFVIAKCTGCAPSTARPAAYGAELTACTTTSATLEASIACENGVRARYGRPLRDAGGW